MYRKRIAVALSTLGLLLMACDGTVVSPEASEAPAFTRGGMHGPDLVRIKGYFTYSLDFDQPLVPCVGGFVAGDVFGSGKVHNLGETTFAFSTDACVTDLGAATLTAVGPGTFTAANGDAISGPSTVIFDLRQVLSGTSDFGALKLTGEITGGAGRFAGATGSISARGVNDFTTGSGTFTLFGTINP